MLKIIELWERKNPRIFWSLTVFLGLIFSSFDDRSLIQFQQTQNSVVIEKTASWVIITPNPGGAGETPKDSFMLPDSRIGSGDRGPNRLENYDPKPKFPWEANPPSYTGGSGSGSSETGSSVF